MRRGRIVGGIAVLVAASMVQGCSTVSAVNNLVNGIIGTAGNAAGKTINTAGSTAGKALTPSTYSNLAKKSKRQPRSYKPSTTAPRTSARNHDAQNSSSNSTRKGSHGNSAASYFKGRARR